MEVFFAYDDDCTTDQVTIRDEEAKHLARVARKKIGETIAVTSGNGVLVTARIEQITKSEVICSVLSRSERVNELPVHLILAISLLKNPNRFDMCIEKATELGVHEIIPFISTRTISHRESPERWKQIARAAMKQSCRCVLPQIHLTQDFSSLFKNPRFPSLVLLAHERQTLSASIPHVLSSNQPISSVMLIVGPEGGFTDEEVDVAEGHGCHSVSLGRRRLRSETAALVGLSQIVSIVEAH